MTQEGKNLLLKDLSARLPYKVIVEFVSYKYEEKPWFGELSCKDLDCFIHDIGFVEIKPYLYPLSNMTEEQNIIYGDFCYAIINSLPWDTQTALNELVDWLNKNHFDYRGLIEKGLAIEVTEDNNPYKK